MLKGITPPNLLVDKNIKALVEAVEPEFEKIKSEIVNVLIYPRIDELDEEVLDLLAWQFHIEGYDLATDITEKRNLIKKAIELHRYKGTRYAIEEVLKILGLEGQIKEWYETNGELPPYTFSIITEKEPDSIERLIKLVNEYKNVRSQLYTLSQINGNCKLALRGDISNWDNALIDDIEGVEIEGVKVCFTEASDLSLKFPAPKTSQNTYSTYGNTAYYPFTNKLDFINWDNWEEKELNIESEILKEISVKYNIKAHNFNDISIFRDELSDELVFYDEGIGFIGETETIDSLFFDNSDFDSQKIQKLTVLFFEYKTEEIKSGKLNIKIKSSSGTEISKEIDGCLELNLKVFSYVEIMTEINSLKLKRYWKGKWQGKWTDDYQIEGKIEVR